MKARFVWVDDIRGFLELLQTKWDEKLKDEYPNIEPIFTSSWSNAWEKAYEASIKKKLALLAIDIIDGRERKSQEAEIRKDEQWLTRNVTESDTINRLIEGAPSGQRFAYLLARLANDNGILWRFASSQYPLLPPSEISKICNLVGVNREGRLLNNFQ